jgi:hypothetical protein
MLFKHYIVVYGGHRPLPSSRRPLCGMVFGMATTKITITLEDDQVRAIREYVSAGKAANISAFVKHAVGVALFDAAGWRTMLDDALRQTGGPLTKAESAWADSLLHDPETKKGTGKNRAA